jgi:hypothetical protein
MIPVKHEGDLPGSKKVYTPWIEGAVPFDPLGLNLRPISLVEDTEEEEDEETPKSRKTSKKKAEEESVDQVVVEEGQAVVTEFGPGRISKVLKNQVEVIIPGFGRTKLPKAIVFVPGDNKNLAKLNGLLKQAGSRGLPTFSLKNGTSVDAPAVDTDIEDNKNTSPNKAAPKKKLVTEEDKPKELPSKAKPNKEKNNDDNRQQPPFLRDF